MGQRRSIVAAHIMKKDKYGWNPGEKKQSYHSLLNRAVSDMAGQIRAIAELYPEFHQGTTRISISQKKGYFVHVAVGKKSI